MDFEWDDVKAESNERKHGVAFTEAMTVFADWLSVTGFDPRHADEEDPFLTMGTSIDGRLLVVSHTDRFDVVRIISAREATRRDSGTGGFALIGESTMLVVQDLNTKAGREFYGLGAEQLAGVNFVPLRVREGDVASCLNLNRAQKPRLLGVKPELLAGRFTFASVAKGLDRHSGWELLNNGKSNITNRQSQIAEVPAIGDAT